MSEAARDIFENEIAPRFERGDKTGYLRAAQDTARRLSDEHGWTSIEQVREAVGSPPADVDPRVLGAVFRPRKQWKCLRIVNSARRTCHGRPVGIWRYVGEGG